MKKLLFLLLLNCCGTYAIAQYTYTLKIMDTYGQALKSTVVTAQNKEADISLKATTSESGIAEFTLTEPGNYTFSYKEMKDATSFEVKEGRRGTWKQTITYDPEGVFAEQEKTDRTGITFTKHTAEEYKGKPNIAAKVTIEVREKSGIRVKNLPLDVICGSDKAKYNCITNASGFAILYLPIKKSYEIDIGGIEAIHNFDIPNYENAEYKYVVYYEQTKVQETSKGDTIFQKTITQSNGSSTHELFTLNLQDYNGTALAGEPVYISSRKDKTVYAGITDNNGTCKFMLQKGAEYLLSLTYERDIHLIDATQSGFATSYLTRRYRGSRAIEKMMNERKMNKEGFVINHSETPVRKATRPGTYFKRTATGYTVDFGNSGPVGTPTIADNKLFTQQGYYSPNFYCIDPTTGNYLWGVELGESGASPAVYEDGILLLNTYSCTLYALEAATGKLLWSKWLAGTIYSTPSADKKSVYVVYNNGGSNPLHEGESFVLTSFDLHTGKMNWIHWLDAEAIACPVLYGEEVHVTSQSGNYYVFNKETGKPLIASKTVKAASSPTIAPDAIYVTALVDKQEQLVVLDKTTLQIKKIFKNASAANAEINARQRDAYDCMNYNGSHPVVYKNKVLQLENGYLKAFDAVTERIAWQQPVKTNTGQIPVVANDKVIITNAEGNVMGYSLLTGVAEVLQKHKGETEGQPVTNNGLVYIASDGAFHAYKSPLTYKWNQWNKDAGHNLFFE